MSKIIYTRELEARLGSQPTFSIQDAGRLFPKTSRAYLALMLHNLWKKNRIFRISRGIYSFHDDTTAAGFAFSPFYYGLQNALSIHGLWEQETNPVILTPRRVRTGLRVFAGANYLVRHMGRPLFFGFDMMQYSGLWVPVSDVEKTFIDLVHFRQPVSDELLAEFRGRLDKKKMEKYIARCPARLAKQVRVRLAKK